jgi:ubiquinone/menaquinone biosynthesis C-methylase UbiE
VTERRQHYSYRLYSDPEMARTFEDRRFGDPIGQIVAAREAETFLQMTEPAAGRTVLDVGTGTARIALLMWKAGAVVTGVDASEAMLAVARERVEAGQADVRLVKGDAHALEFPDRSFDIVVSSRVLLHSPEWRRCIDEWCRVARERVVLDYPSTWSVATLHRLWRYARKFIREGNVQAYRTFSDRRVAEALQRNGFRIVSRHKHWVFPIGFYKLVGSPGLFRGSERVLRRLGLSSLGSPVTILAERCASS